MQKDSKQTGNDTLLSVGYLEKDIQDIQDIQKTLNTEYVYCKKTFKASTVLILGSLCYLQNQHSPKQENLIIAHLSQLLKMLQNL